MLKQKENTFDKFKKPLISAIMLVSCILVIANTFSIISKKPEVVVFEATLILGLLTIFFMFSFAVMGLIRVLRSQEIMTTSMLQISEFLQKQPKMSSSMTGPGTIVMKNEKGEIITEDFKNHEDMMIKIMEAMKNGFRDIGKPVEKKLEDMTLDELEVARNIAASSQDFETAVKIRDLIIAKKDKTQK